MSKTKTVFCAHCQEETAHSIALNSIGNEVIFTCECGRFIKVPAHLKTNGINAYLEVHKVDNQGQVSQATLHKRENLLIAELADGN
jgi:transcription elongation factor Elf1